MYHDTDLPIPRTSDILDRACELLGSAYRLQDDTTARQLERLIANLPGARLSWQLGTLIVSSPSGNTYHVTRGGCDCPNGRKCAKRACWHCAAHELLLDLFATDCETADQEADIAPIAQHLGERLATARQVVWAVNWNS